MIAGVAALMLAASPCDARGARGTVARFVRAYDAGDLRTLDRLFSVDEFVWYSSNRPGLRVGAAASERTTLVSYFRRRHTAHDRLELLTLRYNGASNGLGNVAFTLRRRADDYRAGSSFRLSGKGAVSCTDGRIAVLSLGGPGSA